MQYSEIMMESRADENAIAATDKPRLIVIDDSPDWGSFVSDVAEKIGFSARSITTPGDFSRLTEADPADVLVLDLFMPERDGIEMILDMEHVEDRPFIILISGQSRAFLDSAVTLGQGKGLDIIGALPKPFRLPDLRAMLQKAASLVEQKKKIVSGTDATVSAPPVSASPATGSAENESEAEQDSQNPDVTGRYAKSSDSVKTSIAEINTQFCIMLWDSQLATLDTLSAVPSRLAEAAAGVIASDADVEDASGWHQALHIHMQTMMDEQAAVREIANSQQLPEYGRSATESIDRISTIISEILVEKSTETASPTRMLANFRELCSENDRLKECLTSLEGAIKKSLALVHNAGGLAKPH